MLILHSFIMSNLSGKNYQCFVNNIVLIVSRIVVQCKVIVIFADDIFNFTDFIT